MKRSAAGTAITALMAVVFVFSLTHLQVIKHSQAAVAAPQISYVANVEVKPDKQLVTGELRTRFIPVDQEKAYFRLYPNAFRDGSKLTDPNWVFMLGKELEPGEIKIDEVQVNGETVHAAYYRNDPTVLEVKWNKTKTPAGKPVEIMLRFTEKIPNNKGRMSYNSSAIWLGNWLPILAVNDQRGWHLDPYYPVGDPFFSDIADYKVTVKVPPGYSVASSGNEQAAEMTETRPVKSKSVEIHAPRVRDFAMVIMDDTYLPLEQKVGATLVKTWYQAGDDEQQTQRMHTAAVNALRYYHEQFGEYPYPEFDVVKTGGFFGGMEYPGIVFIQGDYFQKANNIGTAVVAHETAHQWFYGLVGNDEVAEAWVDESLADYATMSYLKDREPALSQAYIDYRKIRSNQVGRYQQMGLKAWQPLKDFPDWNSYSDLVYSQGAMTLWNLREKWGAAKVHETLRQYVKKHGFGQATGDDVVNAFTVSTGEDARPYFDYWLRFDRSKEKQAENWVNLRENRAVVLPKANIE
ncbi:MAG: M1 family metallopeptidase [Clostridia bacterium]